MDNAKVFATRRITLGHGHCHVQTSGSPVIAEGVVRVVTEVTSVVIDEDSSILSNDIPSTGASLTTKVDGDVICVDAMTFPPSKSDGSFFKSSTLMFPSLGSKNHTKHSQDFTIIKNTSQDLKKDGVASEIPDPGFWGATEMVPVEPMGEVDHVDDVVAPEHDPTPEPEDPPIDDLDDDPTEDALEEETDLPVPIVDDVEMPQGGDLSWRDVKMYPLPTVRSPTPHPGMQSPFPYTDDDEEDGMDAQTYEAYDISSSDPASPLPPPVTIHVVVHDWIVAQLNTELNVASSRIIRLRQALTAERAIRLGYLGDFKADSPTIARIEIDGIELHPQVQMRMTEVGGYIPVVDAELIMMPPHRRGTRAQPAESVNQQRNEPDTVVNEESEEDLDYNEYDEEEYIEEEAEDTHQGGNPMN
ncbi:hypothetical protein AgCh_028614 [Apium graveolens]